MERIHELQQGNARSDLAIFEQVEQLSSIRDPQALSTVDESELGKLHELSQLSIDHIREQMADAQIFPSPLADSSVSSRRNLATDTGSNAIQEFLLDGIHCLVSTLVGFNKSEEEIKKLAFAEVKEKVTAALTEAGFTEAEITQYFQDREDYDIIGTVGFSIQALIASHQLKQETRKKRRAKNETFQTGEKKAIRNRIREIRNTPFSREATPSGSGNDVPADFFSQPAFNRANETYELKAPSERYQELDNQQLEWFKSEHVIKILTNLAQDLGHEERPLTADQIQAFREVAMSQFHLVDLWEPNSENLMAANRVVSKVVKALQLKRQILAGDFDQQFALAYRMATFNGESRIEFKHRLAEIFSGIAAQHRTSLAEHIGPAQEEVINQIINRFEQRHQEIGSQIDSLAQAKATQTEPFEFIYKNQRQLADEIESTFENFYFTPSQRRRLENALKRHQAEMLAPELRGTNAAETELKKFSRDIRRAVVSHAADFEPFEYFRLSPTEIAQSVMVEYREANAASSSSRSTNIEFLSHQERELLFNAINKQKKSLTAESKIAYTNEPALQPPIKAPQKQVRERPFAPEGTWQANMAGFKKVSTDIKEEPKESIFRKAWNGVASFTKSLFRRKPKYFEPSTQPSRGKTLAQYNVPHNEEEIQRHTHYFPNGVGPDYDGDHFIFGR